LTITDLSFWGPRDEQVADTDISIRGSTATIIRTPFVHTLKDFKGEFLYNTSDVAIWTTVELGIGATAANAACLRPLLSRVRSHLRGGLPSSTGGSKPLGNGTFSRRSKRRMELDPEALVTLDELRAGGAEAGKTEVRIHGGYAQEAPPLPSPGLAGAWKTREIVQSVEIRTDRDSSDDGSSGHGRDGGGRGGIGMGMGSRGRVDTITEDQEAGRATVPYERL